MSSTKDYISIREGFYDDLHQVGFTRFQGAYRKPGTNSETYLRFDSKILNYIYPVEDIRQALLKIGFKTVYMMDDYTSKPFNPAKTNRAVFICHKKAMHVRKH